MACVSLSARCSPQDTGGAHPLPPPTGPHATGRMSFHFKDAARDELETKAADDKRELMVHVFYPAATDAAGERATYVPDAEVMRGPWSEAMLARVAAVRVASKEGAALLGKQEKYPVAMFLPGGGMKALTYHALLEDLASHGWIVAAIDPPYNARGVRLLDGRVLGGLPPAERGWPRPSSAEEERRFYQERVVHWCKDVTFVLDQLTALEAGDGPFAGRLDLQRGAGVFGHSRGGQAAGAVRLLDARVRGGINLDGTAGEHPVQPVKSADDSGAAPFLWIQGPLPEPTDAQLARAGRTRAEFEADVARMQASWRTRLASIEDGAVHVSITRRDVAHIDFSDEPFWDGAMTAATRPAKVQTLNETRAWVRAFLDGCVRGEWGDVKRLAGAGGDEQTAVKVELFGKLKQ
jgi:hypothetical protein